jgi:hypothetical protein
MQRIKITSGEHAGRFIGPNVGGLITNPELHKNPEVRLVGTPYSLYVQERAATQYFDDAKAAEVQAELKALGLKSELV